MPVRTAGEITDWINRTYGTNYRVEGVYNLLARLPHAVEGVVYATLDNKIAAATDGLRRLDADPDQYTWVKTGFSR